MTATHADIEFMLDHMLFSAVDQGRPPGNVEAWIAGCKRNLLDIEAARPGYIERCVNGMKARQRGERITGWRENRGTHGMSYDPDPKGTARPPWL